MAVTKTQDRIKRLFMDIETSPNICMVWQTGHQISVDYNMIVKERAVICICYKWEGMKTVHSLTWEKGDDKKMCKEFAKIMGEADEIVGHNGDRFDINHLRTRFALYGIPLHPFLKTIDTLKVARSKFKFNSNRLDYLGQYFGVGKKSDNGGLETWKSIMFDNDKKAMDRMVKYCKQDVNLLEDIFDRLSPYIKAKTHVSGDRAACPECGGTHVQNRGTGVTAAGNVRYRHHCQNKKCGKWFTTTKI